jgi:hypothetical protein
MRHLIFLMLWFFLMGISSPLIVRAQKITFEGGIVGSLHRADLIGDKEKFWNDDYKNSKILGYSVGPFVKCNFTPETFGTLEIRYITKGSIFGYINQHFTQSFESIRFNYFEVPVLIGTNGSIHRHSGDLDLSFETGISYSKLFSSVLKYDELDQRPDKVSLFGFRDYDLSWIAQVHFPYKVGKNYSIILGFRIERSLISIHDFYKLYNFDYGFELMYLFKNL